MTETLLAPAERAPDSGDESLDVAPCVRAAAERGIVRVGLLGCGVVGSAFVRRLCFDRAAVESSIGARVEICRVAVRRPDKARAADLAGLGVTTDPWGVVIDPEVDVVVEAMGGLAPARELALAALQDGKSFVTANKQLIANNGDELAALARARGVQVRYDAAVGGGAPILGFVDALRSHGLRRIVGVFNGTTNYVLDRMGTSGVALDEAIAEARELGFAEPDSSYDVGGGDAAAKAAIVAAAAFGAPLDGARVASVGIDGVTLEDVRAATAAGRVVKLVAIIENNEDGVEACVRPTALPKAHPLAGLRGRDNGIVCETSFGEFVLTGPGAGGDATAGALIGDIASVVRAYLARV